MAGSFALAVGFSTATLVAQGWQRLAATEHPLPPTSVSMQYDFARERTICLGREQLEFNTRQTMHEWTGDRWLQRTPSFVPAPGPMAFDEARLQVVVLNGWNIYGFDGIAWQSIPSTAPIGWWGTPLPAPEAAAFDVLRGVLVASGYQGQTFELHNGVWYAMGAPAAYVRQLATEPATGLVVGYVPDTGAMWRWNGVQWLPTTPAATPPPRRGAQLLRDLVNGNVLLVGGQDLGNPPGLVRADIWAWNGFNWNPQAPMPGGRSDHGAAMHGNTLVVFGGSAVPLGGPTTPTTWIRTGGTFAVLHETSTSALLAHDSQRGRTVAIVDGNRTWEFDGYRWVDTGVPFPGIARQMGYHGTTAQCVVLDAAGATWLWSGVAWQLATTVGPPPRYGGDMAYDPLRDQTVLFGGGGMVSMNDTWLWNGVAWSPANPTTAPGGLAWPTLAWDPVSGQVLASVSYLSSSLYGALWAWDGTNWSPQGSLPQGDARLEVEPSGVRVLVTGTTHHTQQAAGAPWVYGSHPDPDRPIYGHLVYDTVRSAVVWHDFEMTRTWVRTSLPATTTAFGSGCATGTVPQLAVPTRPEIGTTLALELHRGIGGNLWLPLAATATQTTPLTPACHSYLAQPLVLGLAQTGGSGFGTFALSLPPTPALRGVSIYVQGLQLAANGALFGFADLTGALELRLGD